MVDKIIPSVLERKRNVTLWMMLIPSILMIATSGISNLFVRIIFQLLLFATQLLIVKTLLDDYFRV